MDEKKRNGAREIEEDITVVALFRLCNVSRNKNYYKDEKQKV